MFIALDCTLEQAKSEGCVDVMGIVSHLRDQRMNLVQTEVSPSPAMAECPNG